MKPLKIANGFGDYRLGSCNFGRKYVYVAGTRLVQLCRSLNIRYARAITGFRTTKFGSSPVYGGVVVTARTSPKLQAAIAARENRGQEREVKAAERERRMRRARVEYLRQFAPSDRRWLKSRTVLMPDRSRWGRDPLNVDEIAFLKSLTPDDRLVWLVYADWLDENGGGMDALKVREVVAACERREQERAEQEQQIAARKAAWSEELERSAPDLSPDWREYLVEHLRTSRAALALARTLRSPQEAHPSWFEEAEQVVQREGAEDRPFTYQEVAGWIRQRRRRFRDYDDYE